MVDGSKKIGPELLEYIEDVEVELSALYSIQKAVEVSPRSARFVQCLGVVLLHSSHASSCSFAPRGRCPKGMAPLVRSPSSFGNASDVGGMSAAPS